MWFYAGDGWFFRREPQDIFRVTKMSTDVISPHQQAQVVAEGTFDGETMVRLLAYLTGHSRPEVVQFIKGPESPK